VQSLPKVPGVKLLLGAKVGDFKKDCCSIFFPYLPWQRSEGKSWPRRKWPGDLDCQSLGVDWYGDAGLSKL